MLQYGHRVKQVIVLPKRYLVGSASKNDAKFDATGKQRGLSKQQQRQKNSLPPVLLLLPSCVGLYSTFMVVCLLPCLVSIFPSLP